MPIHPSAPKEAAARSALHNELGQVLLMGRHYIEHPESTDRAMVALMTRQMNRFLLGESETTRPPEEDALRQAIRLAESIGVTVALSGEAPQEASLRALLAQAIRECAANTVKHAEGDRIEVALGESGQGLPRRGTCPEISRFFAEQCSALRVKILRLRLLRRTEMRTAGNQNEKPSIIAPGGSRERNFFVFPRKNGTNGG